MPSELPSQIGEVPDHSLILAAAYRADRIRSVASSLAHWAFTYLANRRNPSVRNVAARMFSEDATTFAIVILWNEVAFDIHGWGARATAGAALAWDIVKAMPPALEAAVNLEVDSWTLEACNSFAQTYATVQVARDCLEVRRLIPDLFDGPDGPAQLAAARRAWRAFHGVQDESPAGPDDHLAAALKAVLTPARSPEHRIDNGTATNERRALDLSETRAREKNLTTGDLVALGGLHDEPFVRGRKKKRLSMARFNVVKTLIEAGSDGLTGDELARRSGHGGAVNVLKALARSDPDWKSVIRLAGEPGRRYRIQLTEIDGR